MRKIIHFDMDYFFAQVEIRDNPKLKGRPVGIGGKKRGVLCTCNYEARKFGLHSAMPTFKALEKCPDLIMVRPNFQKYKEASNTIFEIFRNYTDIVQGVSLDEAYLDVTNSQFCLNSATLMAKEIKEKIYKETGLTGSAGVSFNKLLAKICSDLNKPNGLVVMTPDNIQEKIKNLKVKRINGVGKVTSQQMKELGIETFGDLQLKSKLDLINEFGSFGPTLYDYSRGIDHREVYVDRERKSLSVEKTFSENVIQFEELRGQLESCYYEMKKRLEKHIDKIIQKIFIKVKYCDFSQTTIERSFSDLSFNHFENLLSIRLAQSLIPVRLLGIGVRFHCESNHSQLDLPLDF